jgi:hypothetical protein
MLGADPVLATKNWEPVFNPKLTIERTSEAISIDGSLDDAGWRTASRTDMFVERYPGDMIEPDVKTEAYVTYDDDHLYVAFFCHDDPDAIRATMCQRDQFGSDDAVVLLIDTYGDASWAYEFFVNPYGVQKDRLWSSVGGEDVSFDLIWQSAAQITDSGYQVEIAVPFASMRFPNQDVQNWKIDFWRNRPRESFKQYSWAAYDRNEQCWPCQWGTVEGISDVRPGKGLEIMPALVASQHSGLVDSRNPDSHFADHVGDGELSLGAKYAVSSDVTIEAALNPDFSQIEADAAQIDVNTTIALLFPERRPFFQEGSDIFRTLFNSFYTRTVYDPSLAVKLTGRMDKTSIGFFSAIDENSPYMIPLNEASIVVNTGQSVVNVLRASRRVGDNSQVGLMVSDRRFEDDGSGTVFAIDGDIRLSRNYSIDGQFLISHTQEANEAGETDGLQGYTFDNGSKTLIFDGESFYGGAFIARFKRSARHWNFILGYNQVDPSYRTQTGYDPWVNYRNLTLNSWYEIRPEKTVFQSITPSGYVHEKWDYDGVRKTNESGFNLDAQTRVAQTSFNIGFNRSDEVWSGVDFDHLWSVNFGVYGRPSSMLGFSLNGRKGVGIARFDGAKGNETGFYASLDLKPIDRLIIEPTFNYLRSTDTKTDEELFSQYIARARVSLQANRELSLRLVVQYNDGRKAWNIDPLITYRISPFSVFYVGSTYDYREYDRFTSSGTQYGSHWDLNSRRFFMKLQYLFQT